MSIQEPKQEDTISIVSFCLGSCIDMPEDGLSADQNCVACEGNVTGYINLWCDRLNKCGLTGKGA